MYYQPVQRTNYYVRPMRSDEIYHFGTKGMHWGVRKYQNEDGSLTAAGERRYNGLERKNVRLQKRADRLDVKSAKLRYKYERKVSGSTRAGRKAARLALKSDKLKRRASAAARSGDTGKQLKLEAKAQQLKTKSQKYQIKNDRAVALGKVSRSNQDAAKKYLIKSEKLKYKAEKARDKLAKNKRYMQAMKTPAHKTKRR